VLHDLLVDYVLYILCVEGGYIIDSLFNISNPLTLVPLKLIYLLIKTAHPRILSPDRLLELEL
jgi:hypothetical protein